ncbi:hypothetical protein DBR47_19965 [Paucibacter sp. KBW04]|uniref:ribosomal protein L7/L12 n=1 Tax=Paucibacter sp. KBW04 TaxID=2153361 RepID=UPI000F580FEC|nr:ribosomal protein L7/L12 [Paucibacter sp. KBW04]RQO55536.1 hypothetical protein DBR47_19965 [Paucibacter sp. KBW04]
MNAIETWTALILGIGIFQLIRIHSRLSQVEAKLQALLLHLNAEPEGKYQPPSDEVLALAREPKQQIAAIKAYREQTGLGLKEAKEVVDGLRNGAVSDSAPKH